MVRSEKPEPVDADQSLGDLVALASSHVSALIRYEIDLAKTELRGDVQRIGMAAGLGGLSFFFCCLVLVFLGFAYGYGLIAAGVWAWAAFLIVAGTCVVFAAAAVGIAYLRVRKLSGLRLTKKTVTEDLAMLRGEGQQPLVSPDGDRPGIGQGGVSRGGVGRGGQQAGIAAREAKP